MFSAERLIKSDNLQKEITMTYTTPEIKSLGTAEDVIQMLGKGNYSGIDPATGVRNFDPTYDLDE